MDQMIEAYKAWQKARAEKEAANTGERYRCLLAHQKWEETMRAEAEARRRFYSLAERIAQAAA